MTKETKISREMAEQEFDRFCDLWDIDSDTDSMSVEDLDSFEAPKRRLVRAIEKGQASINEEGHVLFKLLAPTAVVSELTFKVPSGQAYMTMDKYKDRQNMHKLQAFMGSMTSQSPSVFSGMDGRDVKFCQGVALLFMGS